jgi:peptide/nickel transport system permease protein
MDILKYTMKRILQMIPVFIIVTVIIFFLIRLIPGDQARVMLGSKASEEAVAAMQKKMGLDKTVPEQFWIFFKDLLHLDLGTSSQYNIPVIKLIAQGLLVTVALTAVSTLISMVLSFVLGYWAGMHKDKWQDQTVRLFTLLGLATPSFWVGLMLLIVFAVNLGWFSVSGWGTTFTAHIKALILPGITQALSVSAILIRNMRNSIVDIKDGDYVEFARSKGLKENRIKTMHILRNALIPTTTLLSLKIAYMLGGSVVIENVFSLPGIGNMLVNSIFARDYSVVQGVVLTFVVLVLVINLLTDILYSILDPRVKLG